MTGKQAEYHRVLKRYLPDEFIAMVCDLLLRDSVQFKIVKPRKTKLGDFRSGIAGERPVITVNGNLNKYSFLITTLHEFAHLHTFLKYRGKVQAHGTEWKKAYTELLIPVLDSKSLPMDLHSAITNSLCNVKASSCSDQNLLRVLMRYDQKKDDVAILEDLNKNCTFVLNGKTFLKGSRKRTRFVCTEQFTNKLYLVNALAHVKEIRNE